MTASVEVLRLLRRVHTVRDLQNTLGKPAATLRSSIDRLLRHKLAAVDKVGRGIHPTTYCITEAGEAFLAEQVNT